MLPPPSRTIAPMTLEQALAVLAANCAITEGSFMFALHERDRFDPAAFWELYNAAIIAGATDPATRGEDFRRDALWTYRNILTSIIWHLEPADSGHIDDLPTGGALAAYLERVEWGFHPLIIGRAGYDWDRDLDKDLPNPRQGELRQYFAERAR
jgi:hypothetical protein